jgi:hypothetical protein
MQPHLQELDSRSGKPGYEAVALKFLIRKGTADDKGRIL